VTCSLLDAGTDIDLSLVWNLGALRLTVRDHGPSVPGRQHPGRELHEGHLTLVARLSRAFGSLPTADGGKVLWAVLDAPRPPIRDDHPAVEGEESLRLNDARAQADQGSGRIIEGRHQ